MAQREGIYSRTVAWLKIMLPLVALALLSTMFLLARSSETSLELPFSDVLGSDDVTDEQVGAPFFAGSTARGELLTFKADRARPLGLGRVRAEGISARVTLPNGGTIDLASGLATLEDNSVALLEDEVQIVSSEGYELTTPGFRTLLDRIEGESLGPVTGTGPTGTLDAGKLEIRIDGEKGDVHLLFTGGVKLVYLPRN